MKPRTEYLWAEKFIIRNGTVHVDDAPQPFTHTATGVVQEIRVVPEPHCLPPTAKAKELGAFFVTIVSYNKDHSGGCD
jgi:hypothetical protein